MRLLPCQVNNAANPFHIACVTVPKFELEIYFLSKRQREIFFELSCVPVIIETLGKFLFFIYSTLSEQK